ncbi:MAG: (4Fe-4S)-binding protein [Flavobacteriaceae bacterium]
MSEREIVKKYTKGDLTIIWKPKTCIHAGVCVKKLPNVYDPKARPWITPENAGVDELNAQIDACPSAALSYETQSKKAPEGTTIRITVKPNGPVLVHGTCELTHSNGSVETKERVTALCRCGASENKPFCDGAHNTIEFKG